jgi:hypothetical protein
MAPLARIVLTAFTAFGVYGLTMFIPGSLLESAGVSSVVIFLMALGAAFFAARFVWGWTSDGAGGATGGPGLVRAITTGALVTGGIGFVGGFFGPMIIDPSANQGPMLGIFITGPLGFIAGGIGGAVYWAVKRRSHA